ncbi:unnamed protein product [Polarella glacialis]|uniref:Uncharacterized protein n=1 Tax=Polarella glacialis TaxID=89957 RepID=A0A813HJA0_POLGL|nr:unnamed protein product [Polarella glacialis]
MSSACDLVAGVIATIDMHAAQPPQCSAEVSIIASGCEEVESTEGMIATIEMHAAQPPQCSAEVSIIASGCEEVESTEGMIATIAIHDAQPPQCSPEASVIWVGEGELSPPTASPREVAAAYVPLLFQQQQEEEQEEQQQHFRSAGCSLVEAEALAKSDAGQEQEQEEQRQQQQQQQQENALADAASEEVMASALAAELKAAGNSNWISTSTWSVEDSDHKVSLMSAGGCIGDNNNNDNYNNKSNNNNNFPEALRMWDEPLDSQSLVAAAAGRDCLRDQPEVANFSPEASRISNVSQGSCSLAAAEACLDFTDQIGLAQSVGAASSLLEASLISNESVASDSAEAAEASAGFTSKLAAQLISAEFNSEIASNVMADVSKAVPDTLNEADALGGRPQQPVASLGKPESLALSDSSEEGVSLQTRTTSTSSLPCNLLRHGKPPLPPAQAQLTPEQEIVTPPVAHEVRSHALSPEPDRVSMASSGDELASWMPFQAPDAKPPSDLEALPDALQASAHAAELKAAGNSNWISTSTWSVEDNDDKVSFMSAGGCIGDNNDSNDNNNNISQIVEYQQQDEDNGGDLHAADMSRSSQFEDVPFNRLAVDRPASKPPPPRSPSPQVGGGSCSSRLAITNNNKNNNNNNSSHAVPAPPGERPERTGRRPLGASAQGGVMQPGASLDLSMAFTAVKEDDPHLLAELVRTGILKVQHVTSRDLVDAAGRTLAEAAADCKNRRASNYFRNGLVAGPSFFATTSNPPPSTSNPYVAPLGLSSHTLKTPGHGLDPSSFQPPPVASTPSTSYVLSYPSLPEKLKFGQWHKFTAEIREAGAGGKVLPAGEAQLRFAADKSFPEGLLFNEEDGTIVGVPQDPLEEEFIVEISAAVGDGRHAARSHALCVLTLRIISAPEGLTYRRVERILDLGLDCEPKGFGVAFPPLDNNDASRERSRAFGQVLQRAAMKFEAIPELARGMIEYFEILPDLPEGMNFDYTTGVLSGLPKHRFPMVFRQTYEIFGYNSVGMSSCTLDIEVIGGKYGLANLRLRCLERPATDTMLLHGHHASFWSRKDESGSASFGWQEAKSLREDPAAEMAAEQGEDDDDEWDGVSAEQLSPSHAWQESQELGPPLASPWLACTFPAVPSAEPDWCKLVDKAAVVLDKFGSPMMMPGDQGGSATVSGMEASLVASYLGLKNDGHNVRRLIRIVEQQARLRREPAPGSVALGAGLVQVGEAGTSSGDSVLYLRKVGATSGAIGPVSPGVGVSPLFPPAPRIAPPARPMLEKVKQAEEAADARAHTVNNEFQKLLPFWRSKLRASDDVAAKHKAMQRWRQPPKAV